MHLSGIKRGILAATFCMSLPAVAPADTWIKASNMDCRIWSSAEEAAKDTATWTGICSEGRAAGSGRLDWFVDGKLWGRYEGEMSAGRLNGRGVLHIQMDNGGVDVIDGTFDDGEPVGVVSFRGANGDRFKGELKSGAPDGYGTFEDKEGNVFDGYFVAGQPQSGFAKSVSGEEYLGEFKNGERHGEGVLIKTDGELYAGQFEAGIASGLGRLADNEGGIFVGQFANGAPDGYGTYVGADGTTAQGRIKDGKPDGLLLITTPDGKQSVETWQGGRKVK